MIPVSALSIAIFLILKKVPPAYGMIVGALAGGLIGGADLTQTVTLMSLATASTTAGTVVASNVFSSTLIELGITSLAGAAMIHAGATVLDHMPHGSFFHATGGSVHMGVSERLKLIPLRNCRRSDHSGRLHPDVWRV